jgi:hypothetical protein
MGLDAIGFDIDPLSVFIGRMKSGLESIDPEALQCLIERLPSSLPDGIASDNGFRLPHFLTARRAKRLPPDAARELEIEVGALLRWIRSIEDPTLADCCRLALSHALATRVSLRWMGTGDDRFALEIGRRSVTSLFASQLRLMAAKADVYRSLRQSHRLNEPGNSRFAVHDATALPLNDSTVDAVVTSPPYLPAASGRETYLRSRAVSLVALGLMSEPEILATERRILGSILCRSTVEDPVPASVTELASWMAPQRARGPKADPTIAYFQSLRRCLKEIRRVLRSGGVAALVVSKSHSFYELVTRNVVREFDMAGAVAELAREPRFGVGLDVERVIHIELPKLDYAARPGARGAYHESILLLRKAD